MVVVASTRHMKRENDKVNPGGSGGCKHEAHQQERMARWGEVVVVLAGKKDSEGKEREGATWW